jgi:hypothetical protein
MRRQVVIYAGLSGNEEEKKKLKVQRRKKRKTRVNLL